MRYPKSFLTRVTLLALSLGYAHTLHSAETQFRAKITIDSAAQEAADFNAPCYVVPLVAAKQTALQDLKFWKRLSKRLDRLGYIVVVNPQDAKVFIKVDYAQPPPFEADVTIKNRDTIDYSHSASTRNYAATMAGGRYQELGNPQKMRDTGATGYLLGPDGKPIDVGLQENYQTKIVDGETETKRMILHPTVFQVSAWSFPENDPAATPTQLWQTTTSLVVPAEEPIDSQLKDLSQAALKELAKNLKAPKEISRSRR